MRGGTLFSGIGAPECAAPWIDWRWCAEIEPFPSAVHAARFPGIPNLGDVTKADWSAVDAVDVVVFGSPCQAFSVAGRRAGLDDPRGNLTLVGLAAIGRVRPRWLVWENVPGVLSIDGGRTFGAVLGLMGQLGYGVAYRVLDAQHFGVPQRRRRVFVVGYLGDWRPAAAVLFEPDCLSGHPPPRRKAREDVAGGLAAGSGGSDGNDTAENLIADTLQTTSHDWTRNEPGAAIVPFDTTQVTSVANRSNPKPGNPRHPVTAGGHPPAIAGAGVRRLMPVETERLQGLPDGWTDIVYRGKPAADGPRYKAVGNSMAVPVMKWILDQVRTVDALLYPHTRSAA